MDALLATDGNFFADDRSQSIVDCGPVGQLKLGGVFDFECYDSEGNLRWRESTHNILTNVALNNVLDVYLRAQTQTTTWYMLLIDNSGFVSFAAADTLASHSGWTEVPVSTGYTGNRPAWTPAAAASQSIANSSTVNFAILGTYTIKGAGLASAASGTSGILFCEAAFTGGNQTVNNGDTLKVTYTINATTS